MGGRLWERLGLQALASLPLWLAAVLVVVFADDLADVAAAVVAGAGLISLAGLIALLALSRRISAARERQEEVVAQSLALVDCMKQIHGRVARIEAAGDEGAGNEVIGQGDAPLAVVATFPQPCAGNDAGPGVMPTRADAGIVRTPILNLADGSVAGVILALSPDVAANAEGLVAMLTQAACTPSGQTTEIAVPLALLCSPEGGKALAGHLEALGASLLLSVQQDALRDAGPEAARELTRLARLGLRLSLCGLAGIDAAPDALRACAVARLHVDRQVLLAAARENPPGLIRWSGDLARSGIGLVVDGMDQGLDAAIFSALGVSCGVAANVCPAVSTAAGRPRPRPSMPWRATPRATAI